ncbi:hypothetical protein OHS33_31530 [Streptomyces sp. NBC_00536]|uniref:DUF6777 domain-containing protein n=1 Tax=Streptomyces sp. NBC_00536 TaxID=2975769 RepID=UPI002E8181F8|nr:DUF6777 domain-containing protein [Streptomyces sp. NBC_00536]WUC82489.1 hypothetical protein OHS33_31530 [Streptomyces sp. NBC_00536]
MTDLTDLTGRTHQTGLTHQTGGTDRHAPHPPPDPSPHRAPARPARRHAPAGAALLAALGLLAAACGGPANGSAAPAAAPESQDVQLLPVAAPGPDPFGASTATAESAPLQPPLPNATGEGIRTVGGATPGLYGGTQRLGSCDVERQVGHLTSDDAKAKAFAEASGIERPKIPEFLRGLTPMVLRADTRVTGHGFKDGRATGFQSVLQAGTAVLVDSHGMPRVRCACGNPLQSPRAANGAPVLKGDQWPGYDPHQVIVIEPTVQVIDSFVIANLGDNTWIERKTGDDGAQDKSPQVPPPFDPADGIAPAEPAGPADPAAPSQPCATRDPNSLARTDPPSTKPSGKPSTKPSGKPPAVPPPPVPGDCPPSGPATVPPPPRDTAPNTPNTPNRPDQPAPPTAPRPTAPPLAEPPPADVPPDLPPGPDGPSVSPYDPYGPLDPASPLPPGDRTDPTVPTDPPDPYAVPGQHFTPDPGYSLESV